MMKSNKILPISVWKFAKCLFYSYYILLELGRVLGKSTHLTSFLSRAAVHTSALPMLKKYLLNRGISSLMELITIVRLKVPFLLHFGTS